MFEFLKALVILLIAVPFTYIVFNVVFDLVKRTLLVFLPSRVLVPAKVRKNERADNANL